MIILFRSPIPFCILSMACTLFSGLLVSAFELLLLLLTYFSIIASLSLLSSLLSYLVLLCHGIPFLAILILRPLTKVLMCVLFYSKLQFLDSLFFRDDDTSFVLESVVKPAKTNQFHSELEFLWGKLAEDVSKHKSGKVSVIRTSLSNVTIVVFLAFPYYMTLTWVSVITCRMMRQAYDGWNC